MENTSDITNDTNIFDNQINEVIPSRPVQFWTILVFQIPSLACTIYLLYHLLFDKKLRQALHNHVILLLLFFAFLAEMIDNPLYLDAYLHNGRNSFHSSPTICLIWWLIDYGAYRAITIFLTWASFERHILIFYHNRLLGTKRKKILFHYIPLGMLFIYTIGFYIGVILFPPCENTFDYNSESCGSSPCYQTVPWLSIWDGLIHGTICTVIEAIFSITLLIRVIWKRHRTRQPIHWRKHRKMTIQLLSISILSLSITLPQALITAVQQVIPGMGDFGSGIAPYFFYLTTFVVLFLPFISLGSLPELWPKFTFFQQRRQRMVAPLTMTAGGRQATVARARITFE